MKSNQYGVAALTLMCLVSCNHSDKNDAVATKDPVVLAAPPPGTAFGNSRMLLQGIYTGSPDATVFINGTPACVSGNTFYINNYTFDDDATALVVTVKDGSNTASMTVPAKPLGTPTGLTVSGVRCGGVAPFKALFTFSIFNVAGDDIDRVDAFIDDTGNAAASAADITEPMILTLDTAGLHRTRFVLHLKDGKTYETTALVNVESAFAALSAFQSRYAAFKAALVKGDTGSAAQYLSSRARTTYQASMTENVPALAQDASTWSDLKLVEIGDTMAFFEVTGTRDGRSLTSPVVFTRDEEGKWKISTF